MPVLEAALFMIGYGVGDEKRVEELFNKPKKSTSNKAKPPKILSENINVKNFINEYKNKLIEFNGNQTEVAKYVYSLNPEITVATFREIMIKGCGSKEKGANTYFYNCKKKASEASI